MDPTQSAVPILTLVLYARATSEINGSIPIDQFGIIRDLPGVASVNGQKLASMETFVTVNIPQRSTNTDAAVPMRGIETESFLARPKVKITTATGGAYDSELWVDQKLPAGIWNRSNPFSSVLVQLMSPEHFAEFHQPISSDQRLTAQAIRESDIYKERPRNTTGLINGVGLLIGVVMAIRAAAGGLLVYLALNGAGAAVAIFPGLIGERFPTMVAVR